MNIVTRALLKKVKNRDIKEFVKHWDALEALVIRIYRANAASVDDEKEYSSLRRWVSKKYSPLRSTLYPYWQRARVAGETTKEDPYASLLSAAVAQDFIANWSAMQTLPAAREALNNLLLELQGKGL